MEKETGVAELISLAGARAVNIFEARGYCCAEAVIAMMNEGFGGGLPPELAAQLGSGFCHGMGGAGCTCGALGGAEIALGLFLGPRQAHGMKSKAFEKVAKEMHDRFKERFSATCCRVLLKRRKEKQGASCKELTQGGAELAASLLLANRPELAGRANREFLATRESKVGAMAKKLLGR